MKPFSKFLLMMMVVVMAACSNNGQAPRNGQASDDKYTYDYVKKISVTQPKKALQLLRTAEERKMMPDLDINVLRGIVYYNSMLDYKKAKTYTEAALRNPAINKQPARLLETLDVAARIDYNLNHYASCLRLAEKGVDEAYKYDDRRLVAKFLTLLGQCHCETGDPTHAINSFDRAIAILNNENKNSHEWKNYYNLVTAYALKANTLLDMKQYAQLFDMRTDYEEALNKLNALPETINGVNDISNATFYSIYAIGYELSGKHDMGNEMYDKLCNTRSASTPEAPPSYAISHAEKSTCRGSEERKRDGSLVAEERHGHRELQLHEHDIDEQGTHAARPWPIQGGIRDCDTSLWPQRFCRQSRKERGRCVDGGTTGQGHPEKICESPRQDTESKQHYNHNIRNANGGVLVLYALGVSRQQKAESQGQSHQWPRERPADIQGAVY